MGDDPDIRELTPAFLSEHDYVVDIRTEGATNARERYALAVVDLMMPTKTVNPALARSQQPRRSSSCR